jgi:hypothetical protein
VLVCTVHILAPFFGFEVGPPDCVDTGHLEVKEAQNKDNKLKSIFRTVLYLPGILHSIKVLLGQEIPMDQENKV